MGEVHVGLVEDHDLAGPQARAEFAGARVVVLPGGVHHREGRQPAVQVEAQVHLGRRLAPPVPGPVHAVGHQLHGRGVHGVDPDLEAPQQAPAPAAGGEGRPDLLEMPEGGPEELLGEGRAALPVGVGERVARRRRHAEAPEGRRLQAQPVAHVVEADGMGQLGEEHRRHMAPGAEAAGLLLDPRLPRQAVERSQRNVVEKLLEDDHIAAGWRSAFVFHPYRVAGFQMQRQPNFSPASANPMGCL